MTKPTGRPRKDLALYRNGGLTEKRRALVMAMVWDSLPIKEAAAKAGLAEISARQALRVPAVSELMNEQRRARLSGERPRNIAVLADVRDNSSNAMARVHASRALELMAVEEGLGTGGGQRQTPGIVIMLSGPASMPLNSPSGLAIRAQPAPLGHGPILDLEAEAN